MKKNICSFCLLLLLLCVTSGSVLPASAASYPYSAPSVSVDYKNQNVRVSWNKKGNSFYRVYYRQAGKDWKTLIKSTGQTCVLLSPEDFSNGKRYQVAIRCVDKNGKLISPLGKSDEWKYFAAPVLIEAKPISSSKVNVRWKKVPGVSGYKVYYKESGKGWTVAGISKSTAMDVNGLKNNKDYLFTVRCVDKKNHLISGFDKAGVSTHTWLKVPVITSCSSNQNGGLDVKWNPVKGAFGYRLRYKPAGGNTWTYSTTFTSCSYSIPKLQNGKK